jgi:hypothetical protein
MTDDADARAAMSEFLATARYGRSDPKAATLAAIQRKVAISAIPASALRGQSAPGLIETARRFFHTLPLAPFGVTNGKRFASRLDEATLLLLKTFPRHARHWGVARKAINLFLRDAFYNQFLASKYRLSRAAAFYELPLDSITSKAIREFDDEWDFPKWNGLGHISVEESRMYQDAATDIAMEYDCERVHLDAHIWAAPRDA